MKRLIVFGLLVFLFVLSVSSAYCVTAIDLGTPATCSSNSQICSCSFVAYAINPSFVSYYSYDPSNDSLIDSYASSLPADGLYHGSLKALSDSSGVVSIMGFYSGEGPVYGNVYQCVPFNGDPNTIRIISVILGGVAGLALALGSSLRT